VGNLRRLTRAMRRTAVTSEGRVHVGALIDGDLAALAERMAATQRALAELLAQHTEDMATLEEVRRLWRELRERSG
jgi:hypothetical protein